MAGCYVPGDMAMYLIVDEDRLECIERAGLRRDGVEQRGQVARFVVRANDNADTHADLDRVAILFECSYLGHRYHGISQRP